MHKSEGCTTEPRVTKGLPRRLLGWLHKNPETSEQWLQSVLSAPEVARSSPSSLYSYILGAFNALLGSQEHIIPVPSEDGTC